MPDALSYLFLALALLVGTLGLLVSTGLVLVLASELWPPSRSRGGQERVRGTG